MDPGGLGEYHNVQIRDGTVCNNIILSTTVPYQHIGYRVDTTSMSPLELKYFLNYYINKFLIIYYTTMCHTRDEIYI